MMRLLDRTKSPRTAFRSRDPESPTVYNGRPSLAFEHTKALPRYATTLRPQTADAGERHSKLSRLSFFEAFAIDAGNDTFAFPKPSSAKTAPKGIEILTSTTSSREASPMIGVALGSPSHPPQHWSRLPPFSPRSANATPRTPRFVETFPIELPTEPKALQDTKAPTWKMIGKLFRRKTTGSKNAKLINNSTSPRTEKLSWRPSTSSRSPRPKSRGRMLHDTAIPTTPIEQGGFAMARPIPNRNDPRIDHVLKMTEIRISSTSVNKPIKTGQSVTRVFGNDTTTLKVHIHAPSEDAALPRLVTTAPRLELQLPSCEMERYSVMFEKVLDPKPSLLERRKSRLRLLDTSHEESISNVSYGLPAIETSRRLLVRSATSPSQLTRHEKDEEGNNTKVPAFHKPLAIQRSNTVLHLSPISLKPLDLKDLDAFSAHTIISHPEPGQAHSAQIFCDSPASIDDSASFPDTPILSPHGIINNKDSLDVAAYRNAITNVWQSVLPAPPGSSTSSRFSVDVHKALESPRILNRSRSYHGKENLNKPIVRQVQVAVARRVSLSRALHDAQSENASLQPLRPKVIQVVAQAHSRKTSVLDTYDEMKPAGRNK